MKSGWLLSLQSNKSLERFLNIGLLLVVALVVQIFYAVYLRPAADHWRAEQQALVDADPSYHPARSILVIVEEPEPEASIIVTIWALLLVSLRSASVRGHRRLLDENFLQLPPGSCILPGDAIEHLRRFDQLEPFVRESAVARVLQSALKRFGATGSVQDAATTVHLSCEIEATRLDSELSTIRFAVWAIPAIGFVGTVRGLGAALESARFALNSSNPGALTSGLGLSFNSTFVALTLCIIVMYSIHELQLLQDRLVLDAEQYAEDHLISNLRTALPSAPLETAMLPGAVASAAR